MTRRRVLVVEDNLLNMELVSDLLEAAGYEVLQAGTGEQAIEIARAEGPDVVLMDIDLPGMNGLEAAKVLKADDRTRDIPVAALTAFAMSGDEQRAKEAGCVGYLTKPIDTRRFADQVSELLQKKEAAP